MTGRGNDRMDSPSRAVNDINESPSSRLHKREVDRDSLRSRCPEPEVVLDCWGERLREGRELCNRIQFHMETARAGSKCGITSLLNPFSGKESGCS